MRCGEGLRGAPCSASQRMVLRWTFAGSSAVRRLIAPMVALSMSAHQAARSVVLLQRAVPCCTVLQRVPRLEALLRVSTLHECLKENRLHLC
jgi:hypothetical protein